MNKKTNKFFAYPFLKIYNHKEEPYEQIILKPYLYQYLKNSNHTKEPYE